MKLPQQQKVILKFHNGNSVLPTHMLFLCSTTVVNIFIPIYLLRSMRSVVELRALMLPSTSLGKHQRVILQETVDCRQKLAKV
jgi:hypothetical protein